MVSTRKEKNKNKNNKNGLYGKVKYHINFYSYYTLINDYFFLSLNATQFVFKSLFFPFELFGGERLRNRLMKIDIKICVKEKSRNLFLFFSYYKETWRETFP